MTANDSQSNLRLIMINYPSLAQRSQRQLQLVEGRILSDLRL